MRAPARQRSRKMVNSAAAAVDHPKAGARLLAGDRQLQGLQQINDELDCCASPVAPRLAAWRGDIDGGCRS
jgi:hypothetical protein